MHTPKTLLTVTATVTALLLSAATSEAAPLTDARLKGLQGSIVFVQTNSKANHRGLLVHYDKKTVTVHCGDWKSTTVRRSDIRSVSRSTRRVVSDLRRTRVASGSSRTPQGNPDLVEAHIKVKSGKALVAVGVTALALGLAATIGGAVGAQRKKDQYAGMPSCGLGISFNDTGDSDDECKPMFTGAGLSLLAGLGGIVALAGFITTIVGASRWSQYAEAIDKYRPRITIDPQSKSVSAGMSLQF